jgi:hypothetical protein
MVNAFNPRFSIILLVLLIFPTLFVIYNVSANTDEEIIWSQTSNPSGGPEYPRGIAVDDSGVYLAGNVNVFADNRWYGVWRVEKRDLNNGHLIWEQTNNPHDSRGEVWDVAVDNTGVYIVGNDHYDQDIQWRIEKRNLTDGSLIWEQTSNPSNGTDEPRGIGVDNSGIYVVGFDYSQGDHDRQWQIQKRDVLDGSLISTFGIEGIVTSNPSDGGEAAGSVVVDNSGIYVFGNDKSTGVKNDDQWRIEKRNLTDGSIIWVQKSNPTNQSDNAYSIAAYEDAIYLAGQEPSKGKFRTRVEKRSILDGTLIWESTNGQSIVARDIAVDSSGVYTIGNKYLKMFNSQWIIEKRSLADGSLIWERTYNPGKGEDVGIGIACDSSGVYVVGFEEYPEGERYWRIEKRVLGTNIPQSPKHLVVTAARTLAILTPYLVLVGLIIAISTVYIIKRSKD